ncbi:RCC1 domain-containing protein, partial [Salinispora arenicola]|uniref:RCC1 domain-containing protein n=1 Tax=Salinispora arenicola TaxID=168697 RepID=UPI0035560BC1
GGVLAWGNNSNGQLGDGTTTNNNTPVAIGLPPTITVTAIAAGAAHSLALVAIDVAFAWGGNDRGQLGDGTTTDRTTPVSVSLPPGITVTDVAAGRNHSLAVTSTGGVLAWGFNSDGQLGDGTTTDSSTPVAVNLPQGITVTAVAAGRNHSLAITSAGGVLAWGDNFFGQLGDGTTIDRSTPVSVNLPEGITATAVAASGLHSLATTSTGRLLAWGNNTQGQLGDGTTTNSSVPVAVSLPALVTVTAVVAGGFHSLAITSAGTALAWGNNSNGQLGDGTTTDSSTPVAINLPPGFTVTTVTAGFGHSMALTTPPTSTTTMRVTHTPKQIRRGDVE